MSKIDVQNNNTTSNIEHIQTYSIDEYCTKNKIVYEIKTNTDVNTWFEVLQKYSYTISNMYTLFIYSRKAHAQSWGIHILMNIWYFNTQCALIHIVKQVKCTWKNCIFNLHTKIDELCNYFNGNLNNSKMLYMNVNEIQINYEKYRNDEIQIKSGIFK